jgi:hypothetical protein
MTTSLTYPQVKRQLSGEDAKLHRLWLALPEDHGVDEETAFTLLEEAGRRPGDNAWASGMLISLKLLGAVDASNRRSAEFPALPESGHNRPGTEVFNRGCAEIAQRQREQHARTDAARERDYENGPLGRERRELLETIRETVREEIDPGRVTIVEARLRQAEARLTELEGVQAAA